MGYGSIGAGAERELVEIDEETSPDESATVQAARRQQQRRERKRVLVMQRV
jgi:hypothetical protein